MPTTTIDHGALAAFCKSYHIRRLALFGSALRGDFGPESDLDLLAEFAPGHTPGLAFFAIQEKLTELLGRRVDLNTPGFLSPYFRAEVLQAARDLYVEA
jgi:predicted nucleotidyltransferase